MKRPTHSQVPFVTTARGRNVVGPQRLRRITGAHFSRAASGESRRRSRALRRRQDSKPKAQRPRFDFLRLHFLCLRVASLSKRAGHTFVCTHECVRHTITTPRGGGGGPPERRSLAEGPNEAR